MTLEEIKAQWPSWAIRVRGGPNINMDNMVTWDAEIRRNTCISTPTIHIVTQKSLMLRTHCYTEEEVLKATRDALLEGGDE